MTRIGNEGWANQLTLYDVISLLYSFLVSGTFLKRKKHFLDGQNSELLIKDYLRTKISLSTNYKAGEIELEVWQRLILKAPKEKMEHAIKLLSRFASKRTWRTQIKEIMATRHQIFFTKISYASVEDTGRHVIKCWWLNRFLKKLLTFYFSSLNYNCENTCTHPTLEQMGMTG